MTLEINGKHLIAGEWVEGQDTFASEPAHGPARNYAVGNTDLVDRACIGQSFIRRLTPIVQSGCSLKNGRGEKSSPLTVYWFERIVFRINYLASHRCWLV